MLVTMVMKLWRDKVVSKYNESELFISALMWSVAVCGQKLCNVCIQDGFLEVRLHALPCSLPTHWKKGGKVEPCNVKTADWNGKPLLEIIVAGRP